MPGPIVSASPRDTGPVVPPRAWLALFLLAFVYILNFLDRQLLAILAKPIQDDLGVTDGQLGRIGGLYFALFYCVLAIPIGWLADRTNRVRILSLACGLWSAATIACGFAASYPQLAVARMAVGVGEAGGVPPSYAIISDLFPPNRRGTALGIYNLGPPLGQALGVAFGASIAAAYSWRDAFMSLGAIGVLMAGIVYLFVREPERGALDAPPPEQRPDSSPAGFWATCKMFVSRPMLLLVSLACAATQFVTYAMLNFTTLFLMREKGMRLEDVAVYYALLVGLGIGGGIYASGWLIDRLAPRSRRAYALLPAAGLGLAVPFFLLFVHALDWPLAMAFLTVPTVCNYFYLSPSVTLVQQSVRPDQRVLSGALLLLIMNLVGLGLGPTWLGAASDYFRTAYPAHRLEFAFYTLTPFYFVAIGLFLLLARSLGREARSERAR